MRISLTIAFITLLTTVSCKKEKVGWNIDKPYYYFEMDLDGKPVYFESNDSRATVSQSIKNVTIQNMFRDDSTALVAFSLVFKDALSEGDILSLQGRNLFLDPEDGSPYVLIDYNESNEKRYTSYTPDFEYGDYEVLVDTVIKAGTFQPYSYDAYQTTAYIVRGRFEANFSHYFFPGEKDDSLFHASGRFSILSFVPPEKS